MIRDKHLEYLNSMIKFEKVLIDKNFTKDSVVDGIQIWHKEKELKTWLPYVLVHLNMKEHTWFVWIEAVCTSGPESNFNGFIEVIRKL